jgi:hypothetical protein
MAHNWFVSQIDGLIVDMRRGVQTINEILWRRSPRSAGGGPTTPSSSAGG